MQIKIKRFLLVQKRRMSVNSVGAGSCDNMNLSVTRNAITDVIPRRLTGRGCNISPTPGTFPAGFHILIDSFSGVVHLQ